MKKETFKDKINKMESGSVEQQYWTLVLEFEKESTATLIQLYQTTLILNRDIQRDYIDSVASPLSDYHFKRNIAILDAIGQVLAGRKITIEFLESADQKEKRSK